jgi:hypothetical protein
MSSPYWLRDLDYVEDIGSQEKPCTGMYLIIDSPSLANLRRTTALEGFGVEDVNYSFGVEDLNYAYWSPHPCCPEIARLEDILLLLKEEMGFRYGVHHVRWTVEDGIPDLHAMIVCPLDGPLERDDEGWPETAAVHEAFRDVTLPGVVRPWITPRIT